MTIFQLTTSHGGRLGQTGILSSGSGLSTHDLTRRSTLPEPGRIVLITLSTHDLTRRSTVLWHPVRNVIYFQLTTSHGGRR